MILSHKIELKPNVSQEIYFKKACGIARLTYNWALGEYKRLLEQGEKPDINELKKQFNRDKDTTFPFVREVTKCAPESSFSNLKKSFNNFFRKTAQFPDFHKKGKHDSFTIDNSKFKVDGKKVQVPKLGWVNLTEQLRFQGKILSATISRHAHKWFISIAVEFDTKSNIPICENQAVVGVDLGIKNLATLSDGTIFEGPKPLKKSLKALKRKQRQLSRKVKGSKNKEKARDKVARLYYKITCIRKDYLNKLTTFLCQNFRTICIEDLSTANMMKNHKLARAISDMGWYEFRRQLGYKVLIYKNNLKVINRFEATSKTCSRCGWKKDNLTLSDRQFHCDCCGLSLDRDENAAINIATAGLAES